MTAPRGSDEDDVGEPHPEPRPRRMPIQPERPGGPRAEPPSPPGPNSSLAAGPQSPLRASTARGRCSPPPPTSPPQSGSPGGRSRPGSAGGPVSDGPGDGAADPGEAVPAPSLCLRARPPTEPEGHGQAPEEGPRRARGDVVPAGVICQPPPRGGPRVPGRQMVLSSAQGASWQFGQLRGGSSRCFPALRVSLEQAPPPPRPPGRCRLPPCPQRGP